MFSLTVPSTDTACVKHDFTDLEPVAARIVGMLFHLATIHEDIRPACMTIVRLFRPAVSLMYNAASRSRPTASQFGEWPWTSRNQ